MTLFALLSVLVVLAALFSYINYQYFKLPPTIGVMIMALIMSLVIIALGSSADSVHQWAIDLMSRIDFNEAVLHGMLAFLLFAGSLHLDLAALAREKLAIGLLAVVATLISTFLVGLGSYQVFALLGLSVPLMPCLLFGALISPTDPIAVLAIMQKVGAPKRLETQIAGESLFNDGVGVVIFLTLLELAGGQATPTVGDVLWLLLKEAGGGALLGLGCGYLTYQMLKRVDEYQVEILLTLALAMGGYALADFLHVSAPIAAVVAGLLIGNQGRAFAMSASTREHVDTFWELIDGILNAILFLLLGLEILIIPYDTRFLLAGLLAVPMTLVARWISVATLVAPLRRTMACDRGTIRVLTWGALRGGISVALALSLPKNNTRDLLLTATYVVVIFSIVVQGLTVGRIIRRFASPKATTIPVESRAH